MNCSLHITLQHPDSMLEICVKLPFSLFFLFYHRAALRFPDSFPTSSALKWSQPPLFRFETKYNPKQSAVLQHFLITTFNLYFFFLFFCEMLTLCSTHCPL